MTTLVLIPARGGSKRLPGKNLRTVGGVSLVGHAVRCGLAFLRTADIVGAVMCDTDSGLIRAEAKYHGANVPFLREREYAQDDTSSADTVIRTLDRLAEVGKTFERVVLLQPTSPLRTVDDVTACHRVWQDMMGMNAITVNASTGQPNGAVYVTWTDNLRSTRSFLGQCTTHAMPPERSIDINTAEDLAEAERLWKVQHG